ncbi:helix-turn-helix domain-containing protein, partial [Neobacillus sp. SM06]
HSGNQVAEQLKISRHSVSNYVRKFNKGGIENLLLRNYRRSN